MPKTKGAGLMTPDHKNIPDHLKNYEIDRNA